MIRLLFLLLLLIPVAGNAETIVRFYLQQGAIGHTVDLKLYDIEKPATVANFMSYVNDGSYNNSFIHRHVPGFIMQGGGYVFDVATTAFVDSYSKIPTKVPVVNEPGISNLRGTIAMAKVAAEYLPDGTLKSGTGPDSATSEWFFNLSNNSSNLNLQNGGFTVFGEVINNGLSVLDSIASLQLYNLGGAFTEMPLVDYILDDTILTSNLVQLKKVERLFKISSDYAFDKPTISASDEAVFVIENISDQNLNVGSINKTNSIETPFVITNDGCTNSSILPGETCAFNVSFSNPEKLIVYVDELNIAFPDLGLSYTINVSGSFGIYGTTPKGIYNIGPSSDYDYGEVTPNSNLQPEFFIENISDTDLVIGDMGSVDPIEKPFAIKSARCINWVLSPGEKCTFILGFRPTLPGKFSSSFNIEFPELGSNHKITLTGIGGEPAYEPDITVAFANRGLRSANFGNLDFSSNEILPEYTVNIAYQNLGTASLTVSDVLLITSQPEEFSIGGDCLNIGSLANLVACYQSIIFTPASIGKKEAILRIVSDDPDEAYFDYTVIANVLAENDGVDKVTEDAGPNGGDANYDGTPDSEQSNIVSLPDLSGNYVTYIGDPGVRYSDVKFSDRKLYQGIPDQVSTTTGVFEFTVENVQMTNRVKVGMILPASSKISDFYVYGPTSSNSEPHWYKLISDEEVGVVILPNGTFNTDSGQAVSSTFVTLYLKNGSRGDSTFDADNKLKVIGGFIESSNDSSGQLHLVELLFILLTVLYVRNIKIMRQKKNV